MTQWLALIVLCLFAGGLHAETVVLKADRLLDVRTGRYLTPAVLVVDGDKIAAVNPAAPPSGARVVDLGAHTLLPGFIDLHTHLVVDLNNPEWVHDRATGTPAEWALRSAANARLMLLAGFTTVRDVGNFYGFTDVALSRAIEKGLVEGPQVIPVGNALGITGGHCDTTGFAPGVLEGTPELGVIDGVDAALRGVRYQIKHGVGAIKICATAGIMSGEGPAGAQQLSDAELKAIVEEARRHGVRVAAHAHGTEGIAAAVRAGVTTIEHGTVLDDATAELMKEMGTYWVATSYIVGELDIPGMTPVMHAKTRQLRGRIGESIRLGLKHGVRIAFGSDELRHHGRNAKEFESLVGYGLTPAQAIRAGTLTGAEALGMADRGELVVGKLADIVAVRGDPLADIKTLHSVAFVMKDGKVYKSP